MRVVISLQAAGTGPSPTVSALQAVKFQWLPVMDIAALPAVVGQIKPTDVVVVLVQNRFALALPAKVRGSLPDTPVITWLTLSDEALSPTALEELAAWPLVAPPSVLGILPKTDALRWSLSLGTTPLAQDSGRAKFAQHLQVLDSTTEVPVDVIAHTLIGTPLSANTTPTIPVEEPGLSAALNHGFGYVVTTGPDWVPTATRLLAANLPLLVVGSGVVADFVTERHVGIVVSEPAAVAATLAAVTSTIYDEWAKHAAAVGQQIRDGRFVQAVALRAVIDTVENAAGQLHQV